MRRISTLTAVCAIALIGSLAVSRWMKSPRAEPIEVTGNTHPEVEKKLQQVERQGAQLGFLARRRRVLSLTEHSGQMGDGNALVRDQVGGKWYHVQPGTAGEIKLNAVCR